MSAAATVYAVFGSREEADRIARAMVEKRLAACVNILAPMRSVYRWDGAIETGEEIPALFKTAKAEALIAAIAALHSYDVPAICAWPIEQGHPPYIDWIVAETVEGR
ncbi:divalent-cation tolerance protein CutA [Parasphingopyxis marina]|uniref:Divalent-cation tolerance protein CutA n=1 Tax=Parasphingopyxis marina TaxID=2761622 RepID=A0A842HYZ6_9SPHN|nr:divalent-cation tolerance protein CutA [Parasphingopyxis marina]MBC2778396.1 divalent-cation tolerance protein CutA [Parasphingopyxis marina]